MSSPSPLRTRRPELVLSLLLSGCLVSLSFQVRRPEGLRAGEAFLLDASAPFVWAMSELRLLAASLLEWGSTRTALVRENRTLRERAERLSGENLRLRDAERDRDRLLALFATHPAPPPDTRAAHVVALVSEGPFRTAILDGGTADGISIGGVVAAADGILGRVVAAGKHTARVQLLGDRTAAAGVLLSRTGRIAVARGDGAGGVGLQYVPKISDLVEGDLVVTAGTDGVYPKDLVVGRIQAVRRGGPSLFLELPVTLAADPAREAVVFVLPRPLERAAAEAFGPPAPSAAVPPLSSPAP